MFAILLHENMDPFYKTISSFPTIVFTLLFFFCIFYWVIAALGLIDLDIIDFDLDGDIDAADSLEAQGAIAGLILKLGLHGVPLIVSLTIMSIFGWLVSFYTSYFAFALVPGKLLEFLVGIPILIGTLIVTVFITRVCIKPIRKFFAKLDVNETKYIIGQSLIVRSGTVNNNTGQGFMNDGGAGVLLDIRTKGELEFKKGDEVVVIEKLEAGNTYRVISKVEFEGA